MIGSGASREGCFGGEKLRAGSAGEDNEEGSVVAGGTKGLD